MSILLDITKHVNTKKVIILNKLKTSERRETEQATQNFRTCIIYVPWEV